MRHIVAAFTVLVALAGSSSAPAASVAVPASMCPPPGSVPCQYVSLPDAQTTGWAVPIFTISAGTSVDLVNIDSVGHNFRADCKASEPWNCVGGAYAPPDPATAPSWCGEKEFKDSRGNPTPCDRFFNKVHGIRGVDYCVTDPAAACLPTVFNPVLGIDQVPPGTYQFYCELHAKMVGTLTVIATYPA